MTKSLKTLSPTPGASPLTATGGAGLAGGTAELATLKNKTGLISGLKSRIAASKAAGVALRNLQTEQVAAEEGVAMTGLRLAEVRARTTLVATAMPQIGSLTVQLNAATAAVDQALSNTSLAATLSALQLRSQARGAIDAMAQAGHLDAEERGTLHQMADADAAVDVERARARVVAAKAAVDQLHGFAQQTVASAKDELR